MSGEDRPLERPVYAQDGYKPFGEFTLADVPAAPVTTNFGHFIAFSTIPSSPSHYTVPVANCQQWPGYGSRPLYLAPPAGQQMPSVHLIR